MILSRKLCIGWLTCLWIFWAASSGSASVSNQSIEVVVNGKRFASVEDYRQARQKEIEEKNLAKELSIVSETTDDLDEMEQMIQQYKEENKSQQEIELNPDKIKTISISPRP